MVHFGPADFRFDSRIAVIAIYAIGAEWNFQLDFLILQDDSDCTV